MKYEKAYLETLNDSVKYMQNKFKLPYKIANYIYHLGYTNETDIDNYLYPNEKLFHDPFLFPDMEKIVNRINYAITNNEKICIFGDYDVDGIGATYILCKFFEEKGLKVDYFLPSRYQDGYGLTISSIDKVKDLYNPNLIITVDCGITCVEEVEYLKKLGIDIIITDHHEPAECLPDCLKIDCKIKNQNYPFHYLCGAGMALKLVYALSDFESCKKYMTVCAISTISDIVELVDENRYIVKEGLKNFKEYCPQGLQYLFKQNKIIGIPTAKDISFKIAPKINATGRMGDASISLKLYLSNNVVEIKDLYNKVISMNDTRQNLCNIIYESIINILSNSKEDKNIIILKDKNWECGVLGIVCSKVVEKFHKPVILFGYDERLNMYVGSGRSVGNIDLLSAVNNCANVLENFGGHKYACGVSILEEKFESFCALMNNELKDLENKEIIIPKYEIFIEENELDLNFIKKLDLLEPFGVANPEPVFAMQTNSLVCSPMKKHMQHLLIEFKGFNALFFNHSKDIYTLSYNANKEIYFNANLEFYMRKPLIKINIKDYFCNDYKQFNQDIAKGAYILQDNCQKAFKFNCSRLEDYRENNKKTIFISYFNADINYKFDVVNYLYISSNVCNKALLISPLSFNNLENFNEIVFIEPVFSTSLLGYLNIKYPNMKIYANLFKQEKFDYKVKYDIISNVYNILISIKDEIFDEIYLFKKFINKFGIKFEDFIVAFNILIDLECIAYDRDSFRIQKTDKVYNKNMLSELKVFERVMKGD